jgi:hypothetical protein
MEARDLNGRLIREDSLVSLAASTYTGPARVLGRVVFVVAPDNESGHGPVVDVVAQDGARAVRAHVAGLRVIDED